MRVGPYTVGEPLGAGDIREGWGADGRPVMVALFELGRQAAAELRRDAARCHDLDHPEVVCPLDVVDVEGGLALVFEAVRGTTLTRVLAHLDERREVLSDGAALKIGAVIADALHAAHSATDETGQPSPLIHAQLGPHQIYLMFDGRVRLLGLGLGTAFRTAAALGEPPEETKPYIAPECRSAGALTIRANVYSLGALMWRLLGRRPLPRDGSPIPSLRRVRPDIGVKLVSLIDDAIDPSMAKRKVTAGEIAEAIQRSGLADDRDLAWNLELLSEIEGFSDAAPVLRSFPPGKLSDVPPESAQPVSPEVPPAPTRPSIPEPAAPRDAVPSLDWSLEGSSAEEGPAAAGASRLGLEPHQAPPPAASSPRRGIVVSPLQLALIAAGGLALLGLSFGFGYLTGSGVRSAAAPTATPAPTIAATATASPSTPGASADPEEPAAPRHGEEIVDAKATASPSTSATAQAAASLSAHTEDDPRERPPLKPGQAWLIVESDRSDAAVYVNGRHAGEPGGTLTVPCGIRNVRLGTVPLKRWLSPSRAFDLKCGDVTTLMLSPGLAIVKR